MNLKGSSRAIQQEVNGTTWTAVSAPGFVDALPFQSVTGGFGIEHQWIGAPGPLPFGPDEGDEGETGAILADHPDILERWARIRARGSVGRPLSDIASELRIDD